MLIGRIFRFWFAALLDFDSKDGPRMFLIVVFVDFVVFVDIDAAHSLIFGSVMTLGGCLAKIPNIG